MAFFEGSKMTAGYGDGPDIISSCTINVDKGEIVAILGPNGAGKSTAMKTMLGLLNLKSGSVLIDGEDITNLSPQDRVRRGISFVPQSKNVFAELTVKVSAKAGVTKKIFGSVNNIQVAEALGNSGVEVDRKAIKILGGNPSELGSYEAEIKLHKDVSATFKFDVVAG